MVQIRKKGVLTDDLEQSVRDSLVKHSRLKLTTIRDGDLLAKDLGFDSFALLQVVLDLEDSKGVEIESSALAGIRDMTFAELVALVRRHVNGNVGA